MDTRLNPFTPNAGAVPPALTGRDSLLGDFSTLLDRLGTGYTDKPMLVTGLRGVGKTVLLTEFQNIALEQSWLPVRAEIGPNFDFGPRIGQHVRSALFKMSPQKKWTDRIKRAAAALKSFSITVSPDGSIAAGLNVEPLAGVADSGFLDTDLADLFAELGEAAREQGTGVVFLLDEIQFLQNEQLSSIVVALHRVVQDNLPIGFVGAGLPQLPSMVGTARSYAERLFTFPEIGRLGRDDAFAALTEPVANQGVRFTKGALERTYEFTEGYPYFLQEYGRALWDLTQSGEILTTDVHAAKKRVQTTLDQGFFRVRTDKLAPDHVSVLRAMAEIGDEAVRGDDIAAAVDLDKGRDCRAVLADLMTHALVYSARFDYYSFTVPHFGSYLRRRFPFTHGQVTWA